MNFTIEKDIFEYFPGLQIVVVKAEDIGPGDSERVRDLLTESWEIRGKAALEYGNAQSHPFIKPWGERMKTVGAHRKHFPSSVEAMVRRRGKGGEAFSINNIVDFYNSITFKYIVPAGGFDKDTLGGDLCLRFSKEGDRFLALDSDEEISLPGGEVSYTVGNQVVTRHFVYKQSKRGLLTPQTKNALFVSEILGDLPRQIAGEVLNAISTGLTDLFGAKVEAYILSEDKLSLI